MNCTLYFNNWKNMTLLLRTISSLLIHTPFGPTYGTMLRNISNLIETDTGLIWINLLKLHDFCRFSSTAENPFMHISIKADNDITVQLRELRAAWLKCLLNCVLAHHIRDLSINQTAVLCWNWTIFMAVKGHGSAWMGSFINLLRFTIPSLGVQRVLVLWLWV